MFIARLTVVCLVALSMSACGERPQPRGTAITDVTVIDAINGLRENRTVIFDGDEILAIGGPGDELPPAATEIDGRGKYLVPGLWDMHVHLSYEKSLIDSMPAMFLYYGITSVRDTGGLVANVKPIVERMRAEGAHAPRVRWAGPLLDGRLVVYDGDSRPHIGTANATPDDARKTVAALAEAGVDFIKIYELVSPEVFEALVAAAEEHDLPIAAHVPLSMTALFAGPEVDSMEHLRNVELACAANAGALHEARRALMNDMAASSGYELRAALHKLQRMPAINNYDRERCDSVIAALSGTIQVPTLRLNAYSVVPAFGRDGFDEALDLLPAELGERWRESTARQWENPARTDTAFGEWSLKLTGDMNDAGVPIGAGTDTPIAWAVPGYSLHSELQMLQQAGLTPLEVLEAATVRPAQFFGEEALMGAIQPGMRADMLLLKANPLDDIANTRQIDSVISRGRVMTRAELAEKLQAVPHPRPVGATSVAIR